MFFSQEFFEANSIIGSFDNQLKIADFSSKNGKFDIQDYISNNPDFAWIDDITERMSKKDQERRLQNSNSQNKINLNLSNEMNEMKPSSSKLVDHCPWEYDRKIFNLMRRYYPGRFKLEYPRNSLLTTEDQQTYISLHQKLSRLPPNVEYQQSFEYKKFIHLRSIVEKEIAEFRSFSIKYYQEALNEDYNYINPAYEAFIEKMLNKIRKYVRNYDQYYETFQTIQISNEVKRLNFIINETPFHLGKLSTLDRPVVTFEKQPYLSFDNEFFKLVARIVPTITYSKIPLHQDSNAEKLAIKYKANIVITGSAFEKLMQQYNSDDELLFSTIVKEFSADNDTHKVVFVEKPFLKKNLSKREKNEKLFKKGLIFSLDTSYKKKRPKGKPKFDPQAVYNDNSLGKGESFDKETSQNKQHTQLSKQIDEKMDTSLHEKSENTTQNETVNLEIDEESDENNHSLVIDAPKSPKNEEEMNLIKIDDGNGPASPTEPSGVEQMMSETAQVKVIPLEKSEDTQASIKTTTHKSDITRKSVDDKKEFVSVFCMHRNVDYSVWTLDDKLTILVRCSYDGMYLNENSIRKNLVIMPKLEYQPQFGGEIITKEEYCKMWTKSYLRKACDVLLCRLNVFTHTIISINEIKHSDILNNSTEFNPFQALSYVNSLLNQLSNLQNGKYLIQRDTKSHRSYTIMKSSNVTDKSFDLHNYYSISNQENKQSKWLPVDPEAYLPYHYHLNRIPCTFEPRNAQKQQPKHRNQRNKNRFKKQKF